jgi:hypothetical protein
MSSPFVTGGERLDAREERLAPTSPLAVVGDWLTTLEQRQQSDVDEAERWRTRQRPTATPIQTSRETELEDFVRDLVRSWGAHLRERQLQRPTLVATKLTNSWSISIAGVGELLVRLAADGGALTICERPVNDRTSWRQRTVPIAIGADDALAPIVTSALAALIASKEPTADA